MGTVAFALLFALFIMVSVCLHEAGHMVTAKSFGMKVTRYFAGFGPTIFSFRKGETEYGLKAIPLGGFVKIVGMTPQDDDVDPADEPRAMWRQPVWKRTIVMAAGSITHFILGFVLLWITAAFVGLPNPALNKYSDIKTAPTFVTVQPCVVQTSPGTRDCTATDPKSPAQVAGLKTGDKITAVNGKPVSTYNDLVTDLRDLTTGKATITYTRGNAAPTKVSVDLVKAQRPSLTDPDGPPVSTFAVGISQALDPALKKNLTYGPVDGVGQAVNYTGTTAAGIGSAIVHLPDKVPGLVKALSGEPRDPNGPISVVGASELGGQAASLGLWNVVLLLAATLNFFVGVFNLLPLLPLDGGHIAIAWYEKVRSWFARKRNKPDPGRVDYLKLMPVTYAVFVIFAGFSALTILADIINPVNLFGK